VNQQPKSDTTRDRLLNQAEILFAANGFHAVSVREITAAADSNLAAVNYHFGNKTNLYLAVFEERWVARATRIRHAFEATLAEKEHPGVEEISRALADAFLRGPWSDDERLRHFQLIQRELATPTRALDLVGEQAMLPFFTEIGRRLRPHVPEDMDDEQLQLNILSIFAMVIYFNFARAAVVRLVGCSYDDAFKTRLVEHIAGFAAGSMQVAGKERNR
jgi:AcrR family transcriptional regulator